VSEAPAPKPLKPRPRLFVALCAIFALWVGALLLMYFKTVYPSRHRPSTQATHVIHPQ
jgi:hypothetical protein